MWFHDNIEQFKRQWLSKYEAKNLMPMILTYIFMNEYYQELIHLGCFKPNKVHKHARNRANLIKHFSDFSSNGIFKCMFNSDIGKGSSCVVRSLKPYGGSALDRLHVTTPIGSIEVVCKEYNTAIEYVNGVWEEETDSKEYDSKYPLKIFTDSDRAQQWGNKREDMTPFVGVLYNWFDEHSLQHVESINEIMISGIINTMITKNITPHVVFTANVSRIGWKRLALYVERVHMSLEDLFDNPENEKEVLGRYLKSDDVFIMCFQIIHTMVVLQRELKLKHHDLHPGNVFIQGIDDNMYYKGKRLNDYKYFKYRMNDQEYLIPNKGFLIKIADFGLASIDCDKKRMYRVDMPLFKSKNMSDSDSSYESDESSETDETYETDESDESFESNESDDMIEKLLNEQIIIDDDSDDEYVPKEDSWGKWDQHYDNNEGYDLQYLFSTTLYEEDHRYNNNQKLKSFFDLLKRVTNGSEGRVSERRNRPVVVSRQLGFDVFQQIFSKPEHEYYDFRYDTVIENISINENEMMEL